MNLFLIDFDIRCERFLRKYKRELLLSFLIGTSVAIASIPLCKEAVESTGYTIQAEIKGVGEYQPQETSYNELWENLASNEQLGSPFGNEIPEPSTALLFGSGIVYMIRKRKKASII